eukprot:COSAG06_NODE_6684_length_2828_cov_1.945768_5_plen_227_part_00
MIASFTARKNSEKLRAAWARQLGDGRGKRPNFAGVQSLTSDRNRWCWCVGEHGAAAAARRRCHVITVRAMACLPRARQVMPPPAPAPTPEEQARQRTGAIATRLSLASALNELSGQYGLLSGAHLTMLMATMGAGEMAAGELMVSQSVAAALAEFIAMPIAGQLSDSGGRRRVLVSAALGSAALRALVVINPCMATVWAAKLGDALVRRPVSTTVILCLPACVAAR